MNFQKNKMKKEIIKDSFRNIIALAKDDSLAISAFIKTNFSVGNCYDFSSFFFETCIVLSGQISRKMNLYKIAKSKHGVYMFKAIKECKIPNGISKNKNQNSMRIVHKDDIVYIGKAEGDSIITRINNHYKGISSSLRLANNEEFRNSLVLVAFLLKKEFENYRSLVVNLVEKMLQESDVILGNNNNFHFGEQL